jgi:hypothetical protein
MANLYNANLLEGEDIQYENLSQEIDENSLRSIFLSCKLKF